MSKEDYKRCVRQDLLANVVVSSGFSSKIKDLFFPNYITSFLKLLRKYEYLNNTKKRSSFNFLRLLIVKIRFRSLSIKLGFSIPINVFGAGLSIPHYGTIVVSRHAKIGGNCRIHAGVNIGASAGKMKAPKIGDNVYIGPGAIIFGDITIGNDVTIGANATVNRSFNEERCVLAGIPAKIVKHDFPVWWQNNRIDL